MTGVRVVHSADMRVPAVTTPGMDRREAYDHDGVWAARSGRRRGW